VVSSHTEGAVIPRDAYNGAPFKVNREYAERFANRWVILSAKYGFIDPDFEIPGPYNVSFKKKSPELVVVGMLRQQIMDMQLNNYNKVIGWEEKSIVTIC